MAEPVGHAVVEDPVAAPASAASDELGRMEDRYKRSVADLANYRKRVEREREAQVAEGRDDVQRDWFEAVDSVERAVRSAPDGAGLTALEAVLEQMNTILRRQGIERVGAPGEPFDPARHGAVEVRTVDDLPDREIIDVVRSGFAAGGRVLRPALVVVSRRSETSG